MMSGNLHFHHFEDKETLASSLCSVIVKNLQEAIDQKGYATLLVSGGTTPKMLFAALQTSTLAWENVRVGLCDERWVAPTDTDSNELFIKTTLLQKNAAKAAFIGMYHDKFTPQAAEKLCSKEIKETLYPFDVMILGMGADAHTASLFPNNPKLKEAFDINNPSLCVSMTPSTSPHSRMSLTLGAILSAKHLYLHFEGEEKLAVYQEALNGSDTEAMPIRAILQQTQKTIEVYHA